MDGSEPRGPLDGLTVLDLSRVLAGPSCTQLLGDLGATVLKIENPKTNGDDTRSWGPPYAPLANGEESDLSAYYLSVNRNKLSVAADLGTEDGQRLLRALVERADVLIENYKPGGLEKFGLDHGRLCAQYPGLIYCSISGFGQSGPNRSKPGYDLMAQGYGGIMSLTGEADGPPMKVGVAIADVMCGMYAAVGILAALRHRDKTGEGQHIDLSLVDSQMSWLVNQGTNYLTSGVCPKRHGNAHPNIVPYEVVATADGHVIIAVGNDGQFQRFCVAIGRPELGQDERFRTNPLRQRNREDLMAIIEKILSDMGTEDVIARLNDANVPAGPIHTVEQALQSEQARAREMVVSVDAPEVCGGQLRLLGNPLKFSRTPVTYRRAPPRFGQDTIEVLKSLNESD